MMKLKDRIALITGAGSGFGRTTAVMMAKEGAKIGVNDISEKGIEGTLAALKEIGAEGLALPADVSKVDQVKKMFEKLVATWGTIDILVNNAGFALPSKWPDLVQAVNQRFLQAVGELQTLGKVQESLRITSMYKDEWWHEMIDVHLNGTFYCTREALKIMEEKRSGKIINMSSICGTSGCAGSPSYSAAKGAIAGFTKSVAKEVIASNITVNAVAPGYVDTPLLDNVDENVKLVICAQKPIGRMGFPEEIASAIVYLATDEANFFVGQVISPNGGMVI
jgi:3-oxoacyl-[acyl-carrier protein] reductase